jgi:hypothetical protein
MSKALDLADMVEGMAGWNDEQCYELVLELRRLAEIERKYLEIMALEPEAYLHDVVYGDTEPDIALSFEPDNFPLKNVCGLKSLGSRPLFFLPKD